MSLAAITPSPRARELAAATGKDAGAGRGDPVGVARGAALPARADHRRAPPGHGPRERRRSISPTCPHDERRASGCCCCRRDPDASSAALAGRAAGALRRAACRGGQRQRRARLAQRRRRAGARRRRPAGAARPARQAGSAKAGALKVTQVGLADEIASAAELLMGEADEGRPAVLVRGLAWQGRGAAGGGARARAARRICSGERGHQRGGAVRRHRRRQARARPLPRAACRTRLMVVVQHRRRLRASRAQHLAGSGHRPLHARRDRQSRDRLGPRGRDLELHGRRWSSSAARPGSASAMPTSRPTSSARAASRPATA